MEYVSVKSIDCRLRLDDYGHLNKGETSRAASVTITDDSHRIHLAIRTKQFPDIYLISAGDFLRIASRIPLYWPPVCEYPSGGRLVYLNALDFRR